jgi:hypothetical protein
VVRSFLDAYNAHNLVGVLATLAPDIDYADHDYLRGVPMVMHGKKSVAAWLRARFAEGDRLLHGTISIPDAARPWAVAVFGLTRVNRPLAAQRRTVVVAAKVALTPNCSHVQALRL